MRICRYVTGLEEQIKELTASLQAAKKAAQQMQQNGPGGGAATPSASHGSPVWNKQYVSMNGGVKQHGTE